MRFPDRQGHAVTAGAAATVERYDEALDALLLFSDGVAQMWEATVAEEPHFALGNIGRAYLRTMSSEARDAEDAREILAALGDGGDLTDRERRHLAAARAYATGDLYGAGEALSALSLQHPRDTLALVVGHQLDFFCADSVTLRDRVGRALYQWDRAEPRFGFLLGMQAFGLEECGLYPQAEETGLEALHREPRDVWALHAVAHTHEMRGRFGDGLRFLDERRGDWSEGNFLVAHNAWHEALFKLEAGDVAGALDNYDAYVHNDDSSGVALELLDAAGLLWRLHLEGIDVGDRWSPLADAWAENISEPWYVFNDMHATMAFVASGRQDDARELVARLAAYVAGGGGASSPTNLTMTSDVGLPVCRAVVAFGEGRYGDAVTLLYPIRKIVARFGGSHAQRDVVARTLLEAAVRSGQTALAASLVSERLAVKESSPYSWGQFGRVLEASGDPAGAGAARARAAELAV